MNGMRQKIQYSLALELVVQGETPVSSYQGAEPFVAKLAPESPALTEQLMEEVCDRGNLVRAWKRVRQNKGSPGVDGMTIDDTKDYLREHWPSIRSQLLEGTYQPRPVKPSVPMKVRQSRLGIFRLEGAEGSSHSCPCSRSRLIQQVAPSQSVCPGLRLYRPHPLRHPNSPIARGDGRSLPRTSCAS